MAPMKRDRMPLKKRIDIHSIHAVSGSSINLGQGPDLRGLTISVFSGIFAVSLGLMVLLGFVNTGRGGIPVA